MPRHITMETAIRSNEERGFCNGSCENCLESNIPLDKCEKMKPFSVKHTKQGGMIRSGQHSRQQYVPKVADEIRQNLKTMIDTAKMKKK